MLDLPAAYLKRALAVLVERHHVHVGQAVCHLSGFVADLVNRGFAINDKAAVFLLFNFHLDFDIIALWKFSGNGFQQVMVCDNPHDHAKFIKHDNHICPCIFDGFKSLQDAGVFMNKQRLFHNF